MFSWSLQYWWRVDENLKKTIDSFMFCGKKWSRQDTSGVYSYCYLEVYLQKYFWKYSWCPPAGDIWLVKPYKEEDLWVRPYSNTFLMLIFLALGCSRHGVLLLVVVFIFFYFYVLCVYCLHACLSTTCVPCDIPGVMDDWATMCVLEIKSGFSAKICALWTISPTLLLVGFC